MNRFPGGCLCGDVRFVASGPPYRVGLCHCLDCRKHHGALFYAAAVFPQEAVTIDGETRDYVGRHFCPRCGSSVFARSGDEIEVHLGALDAPDQFAPTYESWVVRREAWLPPFPVARRYDGDRAEQLTERMSDSRVLIVVFDALRPDFVTPELMPNLVAFMGSGTRFARPRSFFPTETRVNQTTVLTGCVPARHGVVANKFVAQDLAPGLLLNTGDDAALAAAGAAGPVVHVPMLGERIAAAGKTYASLSAGTPGGGRLIGLHAERDGQVRFAMRAPERCHPAGLTQDLYQVAGPMPDYALPATEWIDWAVAAYLDHIEPAVRPDAMVLWLCEPDESFHYLGIGSPGSLATIRNVDAAFGRIFDRLAPEIASGEMHVIAMSDHGQVTIQGQPLDLPARLAEIGVAASTRGLEGADCVVAADTAGGIWVRDRDPALTERIVTWLQAQPWCGPLFTAPALPGTLALSEILIDHARAPDIALALRADGGRNSHGRAGQSEHDAPYPQGGGCHGGLSTYETNNVLAIAGARVPAGTISAAPVGNIDITPTVLDLLGMPAADGGDGRSVLQSFSAQATVSERTLVSQAAPDTGFRTCLSVTEIQGRRYLDRAWIDRR